MPSTLATMPSTTATIKSSPRRLANAREACLPAALRVGHRWKRRQPRAQQERQPPEHQRDRQVVEPAHHPERDLCHLAALVAPDQPRHRELRRGAGVADVEHEAAVDDVGVGRDDPVGAGVGAVRQAPASARRPSSAVCLRGGRRRGCPPRRPGRHRRVPPRACRPTSWLNLKITSAGCVGTVEPDSGEVPSSCACASAAGAERAGDVPTNERQTQLRQGTPRTCSPAVRAVQFA